MTASSEVSNPRDERLRLRLAAVLFLVLGLVLVFGAVTGNSHLLSLTTRAMIFAMAAMSLDLLVGYGALVSFGHAAFLGVGSYAVGILATHGAKDLLLQIPVALLAATLFAAFTSAISLRTSGVYYIMSTLAFGQMLFFLAVSLSAYGGDDGMTLRGRSTLFGRAWLENDLVFALLVLGLLAGIYVGLARLTRSRFGRVLMGLRENPVRMQAIGFAPFRFRLVACLISGCICALAGVLLANQTEFVAPAYMSWQRSGELLVMVILGGVGTLIGPILGALGFLLVEEWLSGLTEQWKLIFGPLIILIVLVGRGGLMGLIERLGARGGGRG
ncbi:MAG: hypothetical protein RL291_331 [Pseudomonadota bacterium]